MFSSLVPRFPFARITNFLAQNPRMLYIIGPNLVDYDGADGRGEKMVS